MAVRQPLLYTELADWFHLLTDPADYDLEADLFLRLAAEGLGAPPATVLELGSGGGNSASHYKRHVRATLTDLSPQMLEVSQRINPECEHIVGDMRTLRLGRQFDAVLVHDAVMYLTTEADLRAAMETAFVHCRPGGAAVFMPDCTTETFTGDTEQGGHDGEGRALRYLMWTHDPDPTDTSYDVDFAVLLREDGEPMRSYHDHHVDGLFPRATWLRLLEEVGFRASAHPYEHPDVPPENEVFVGVRS
jgi:SAM-dependent methyltransferase